MAICKSSPSSPFNSLKWLNLCLSFDLERKLFEHHTAPSRLALRKSKGPVSSRMATKQQQCTSQEMEAPCMIVSSQKAENPWPYLTSITDSLTKPNKPVPLSQYKHHGIRILVKKYLRPLKHRAKQEVYYAFMSPSSLYTNSSESTSAPAPAVAQIQTWRWQTFLSMLMVSDFLTLYRDPLKIEI